MHRNRTVGHRIGAGQGLLRRALSVVGLALILVMAGFGATASAAVVGLERVSALSTSDSLNKSVTVGCPAGKRVVGAGGSVGGIMGPVEDEVRVEDVVPNSTLTGVTVRGVEDQTGITATWAATAQAVCANPLPGLQRVVATSATDSLNKSVVAGCPVGKRVVGAGGSIDGPGGQVLLDDVIPDSTLTNVTVRAYEDEDGTTSNWFVRAYAICANRPGGLQRVVATSPSDSTPDTAWSADCPVGKQVVGTGYSIDGGPGQVGLSRLVPVPATPTAVDVRAFEDETGFNGNWRLLVYAICAASAERVVDQSATGSPTAAQAIADCPAGHRLTGAGGDISGGAGQVVLDDISPDLDATTGLPTRVSVVGFEDQDGFGRQWFVRAFAICATPPAGLERVIQSSPFDSDFNKDATAACPAGKKVIGAGAVITGAQGQAVMTAVRPNALLTDVTVHAEEDDDFFNPNWSVIAYAICATPPPGLQLVSATSEFDLDTASVIATCPAGKHLLGAGGAIKDVFGADGGGDLMLDDLRPNASLTNVTATGVEDEDGHFELRDWNATAYAICAGI